MADKNELFSFQGYVYIGDRSSTGKILQPVWVGDATMQVAMETTSVTHKESFTGQRMPYGRLTTEKSANVTLTLFEATEANLALALYADQIKTASGSATAEAFPADTVAGDTVVLDHPLVSNLVIKDSNSSPVTLEEGTHYVLEHPEAAHVKILNVEGFTQPLVAAYDYDALVDTLIFTKTPPERWVQLVGVNTLNDEPIIVDLYRVSFSPASQLPLHNEEFGSFELTGSMLVDATLAANSNIGGFGRLRQRQAA